MKGACTETQMRPPRQQSRRGRCPPRWSSPRTSRDRCGTPCRHRRSRPRRRLRRTRPPTGHHRPGSAARSRSSDRPGSVTRSRRPRHATQIAPAPAAIPLGSGPTVVACRPEGRFIRVGAELLDLGARGRDPDDAVFDDERRAVRRRSPGKRRRRASLDRLDRATFRRAPPTPTLRRRPPRRPAYLIDL